MNVNILETAKHEAGHVVVGIALGGRVDSVSINKWDLAGQTEFDQVPQGWRNTVVFALAGLAGERINDKTPGRLFSKRLNPVLSRRWGTTRIPYGVENDLKDIYRNIAVPSCIHLRSCAGKAFLNHSLTTAWNILRDNRDVHAELSRRLVLLEPWNTFTAAEMADLTAAIKLFAPCEVAA